MPAARWNNTQATVTGKKEGLNINAIKKSIIIFTNELVLFYSWPSPFTIADNVRVCEPCLYCALEIDFPSTTYLRCGAQAEAT